jgi:3-hydroxyisobutyrate dehydrogenase
MVGFPKDLEEVCLGENGIIKYMKKGSILVDHTTSKPGLA